MKRMYCQPIVTESQVYTVEVFTNPRLKHPMFHLTVVDQRDDLKFCETHETFQAIKTRICEIEFDLLLDDYCD